MKVSDSPLCFGIWRYSRETGTLSLRPDELAFSSVDASAGASPDTSLVLEPRLHALLNYFLQHPEQIIPKNELLDQLWGSAEGTDAALMRAIGMLRKALRDNTKPALYIETLSKRGYRWIAPIEVLPPEKPLQVAAPSRQPAEWRAPPKTADQAQVTISRPPFRQARQRRLMLLSAFFICAVTALTISLLLFFGKTNFLPAFTRQSAISAIAGVEQKPLLSADRQQLYYQQQTQPGQWRWIAHQLSTHRKSFHEQQYQALSAAQWFNRQLVFQGLTAEGCHFYRLDPQQFSQKAVDWLPCQQLQEQGIASTDDELLWLDVQPQTGATQLWHLNDSQAELLQSFPAAYRRPVAINAQSQQAYILLQQDDFNTVLFRYQLAGAHLEKIADFPYAFHSMSGWDSQRLLLSGPAGSFIFSPTELKLVPLQLASGAYRDQQRVGSKLLATSVAKDAADLVPLEDAGDGRSSALLASAAWLTSNRTDHLLSWDHQQAALVSERSGLPQIWWFDGERLSQLTRFQQWRQISQLLWANGELHAVIDQQLQRVRLTDGSLQPVLFQHRQLRHFAFCHGQWFWAELNQHQWLLKSLNPQQQPIELQPDVVHLNCAPEQSLLLLKQDNQLVRYWPATAEQRATGVKLNWRQRPANSWASAASAIFWTDDKGQIWQQGWNEQQPAQVVHPAQLHVTALYGHPEQQQLFLEFARDPETDVVWLESEPTD